ncbi:MULTISPECIES: hydroxymethylglutaryl-CoA lyase [Acidithrix]|uniref:Hydroxymethylglutaryl-CoA lyase YngG n=1 Tax=Acidithrix ferrooxidans TaxID=1280514 RepID=A0A0D8HE24_9ACTN|nr:MULTISPECIES: hydroxymethylglutaryl-CoA lyase [Acidithrix]KJF16210.1 hydroxymethylglutaryl-CoA lyase YngG [Acidithrix ferrooxidans]
MSSLLPRSVEIVEVSPRDGLQNEAVNFNNSEKLFLIESAIDAGLNRIEVASFVNPKRVPQMADGDEVLRSLSERAMQGAIGLVLNERGLDRALMTRVREINYVVVVTETFSQKNQGMSVAENLEALYRIAPRAAANGLSLTVSLSAAFGCPYEGEVSIDRFSSVLSAIAELEIDEVAIADTIGVAVPPMVEERVALAKELLPSDLKIRCHFHNTRNTGLASAYAAVIAGVDALDSSLGGIGGCPFAPRATGNIPTEDLCFMLERSGISTGVDLGAAIEISEWLSQKMGRPVPALLGRAGIFPPQ